VAVALVGMLTLGPCFAATPDGDIKQKKIEIPETGLTDEQKARHLLNRITYGPRAGDVDRVLSMGIKNFIEQQLYPQRIPDTEIDERLAALSTLEMSSHDLLVAYPPPQLLRGIERQLTSRMGMDPETTAAMFPELESRRERERRREKAAAGDPETSMDPDADPRGGRDRMSRMMQGPARIQVELSQAKIVRAVYSERQLEEVLTDFWFNHFNVFVNKGLVRWSITSYERDAIRPNALGSFRDLLGATAAHPAMLFYLDNWLSAADGTKLDAQAMRAYYAREMDKQGRQPYGVALEVMNDHGIDTTRLETFINRSLYNTPGAYGRGMRRPIPDGIGNLQRGLNENYARELLELHTLGVEGGYTQEDIIEVARCFTGWTTTPLQHGQEFVYAGALHDNGKKTVLEKKSKSRGVRDGHEVLDLLVAHPSTANFVSWKLAQKFVADDPPASLVERMARTFRETEGDIREVMRTMLYSEEFWSPEVVNTKIKTPLEFVVSAVRATGAEIAPLPGSPGGRSPGLVGSLRQMGQPLYAAQPPTGYKETAEDWISTGDLLNRMKVGLGLAANKIPGVRVDPPRWILDTGSTRQLVERLADGMLELDLSPETLDVLVAQVENPSTLVSAGEGLPVLPSTRTARMRLALGWLLASPEFQRQ
jgi:uncharacterized protein (DUF1800 family)